VRDTESCGKRGGKLANGACGIAEIEGALFYSRLRNETTRSPLATAALSRAARSIDFRLLTLSFGICGFSISTAPWPARRSIQTTALRQHPAFEQKLHRVFGTSL
jgi:hypothetical protein